MSSTPASAPPAQGCRPLPASPTPRTGGPVLDSTTLLQGGRAVLINHGGELYRLQATRQGKLILTK